MQTTAESTKGSLSLVRRARRIYRALGEIHPNAHCELDFTNPLELLVATVLSAQSTDKRVNSVTPFLFAKFPTALDYAQAELTEVEELIRPTGFQKQKAKALIGIGQQLTERFDGEVPPDQSELVKLPGVGRKTANVVLGDAFGVPGITVDTHFGRLVRRWNWTIDDDPVAVEHEIGALFPRKDWTLLSHRVIFHGRRVCHARKPACGACALSSMCPSFGEGEIDPTKAEKLLKFPDEQSRSRALQALESQKAL